jgi:hypothetical protein
MSYKIHYGFKDYIVVTGASIEDIKNKALIEADKRKWHIEDLWSEAV